jgi:hypothetical protein
MIPKRRNPLLMIVGESCAETSEANPNMSRYSSVFGVVQCTCNVFGNYCNVELDLILQLFHLFCSIPTTSVEAVHLQSLLLESANVEFLVVFRELQRLHLARP